MSAQQQPWGSDLRLVSPCWIVLRNLTMHIVVKIYVFHYKTWMRTQITILSETRSGETRNATLRPRNCHKQQIWANSPGGGQQMCKKVTQFSIRFGNKSMNIKAIDNDWFSMISSGKTFTSFLGVRAKADLSNRLATLKVALRGKKVVYDGQRSVPLLKQEV